MRDYKYILFDLDGTLIYSHPGIFGCIRYALKELGLPAPKQEQLEKCIGPSLMYSFQNYFNLDEETAREATRKYREEYSKMGVYQNEPIEGVLETLKALKEQGYVMAMATSKPKIYADIIAKRWGFDSYLSAQVGSGIDGSFPTKASVIEEAMKQLGATKEKTLMVGDRFHDLEGARENGIDCALLAVGYAEKGEIEREKPEYAFEDFWALGDFLTK
ncbi:MAG: HAD hydrolase-like protein [Clostridia bacterium]|nr:HAD hydrolase-like protein [Clostridia bacterium]